MYRYRLLLLVALVAVCALLAYQLGGAAPRHTAAPQGEVPGFIWPEDLPPIHPQGGDGSTIAPNPDGSFNNPPPAPEPISGGVVGGDGDAPSTGGPGAAASSVLGSVGSIF